MSDKFLVVKEGVAQREREGGPIVAKRPGQRITVSDSMAEQLVASGVIKPLSSRGKE